MHRLGREVEVGVRRDSGVETAVHIADYDFDWQRDYHLAQPIHIGSTDEVELSCTWDNTSEARGRAGLPVEPVDVNFGEGTMDEMCIAMLYLTER